MELWKGHIRAAEEVIEKYLQSPSTHFVLLDCADSGYTNKMISHIFDYASSKNAITIGKVEQKLGLELDSFFFMFRDGRLLFDWKSNKEVCSEKNPEIIAGEGYEDNIKGQDKKTAKTDNDNSRKEVMASMLRAVEEFIGESLDRGHEGLVHLNFMDSDIVIGRGPVTIGVCVGKIPKGGIELLSNLLKALCFMMEVRFPELWVWDGSIIPDLKNELSVFANILASADVVSIMESLHNAHVICYAEPETLMRLGSSGALVFWSGNLTRKDIVEYQEKTQSEVIRLWFDADTIETIIHEQYKIDETCDIIELLEKYKEQYGADYIYQQEFISLLENRLDTAALSRKLFEISCGIPKYLQELLNELGKIGVLGHGGENEKTPDTAKPRLLRSLEAIESDVAEAALADKRGLDSTELAYQKQLEVLLKRLSELEAEVKELNEQLFTSERRQSELELENSMLKNEIKALKDTISVFSRLFLSMKGKKQ